MRTPSPTSAHVRHDRHVAPIDGFALDHCHEITRMNPNSGTLGVLFDEGVDASGNACLHPWRQELDHARKEGGYVRPHCHARQIQEVICQSRTVAVHMDNGPSRREATVTETRKLMQSGPQDQHRVHPRLLHIAEHALRTTVTSDAQICRIILGERTLGSRTGDHTSVKTANKLTKLGAGPAGTKSRPDQYR